MLRLLFCHFLDRYCTGQYSGSASSAMSPLNIGAAILGVASHLIYFIRNEHHLQAGRLVRVYSLAVCVLCLVVSEMNGEVPRKAAFLSAALGLSYFLGMFTSMVTYRIFFHRLNRFPGPFGAKVSKLWHAWHVLDSKQYLLLDKLHKTYGDFVRTGKHSIKAILQGSLTWVFLGPNEICVFRPEALKSIHGYGSSCTKSAWYDNLKPYQAMNTTRSKQEHDKRRRSYEHGLSIKGTLIALAENEGLSVQSRP